MIYSIIPYCIALKQELLYAFANTSAGGTDEAAGGALNILRSRFSSYANPVPAILEALTNQPIYRDDIYRSRTVGTNLGTRTSHPDWRCRPSCAV
ncbi:MAG: hypothetical protein V7K89_13515 [Nostoc sp.]|uniref:hypothetical protein n=1 Tax=Nostoc sp. TaxID=1180 RepID=UPI002FFA9CEE